MEQDAILKPKKPIGVLKWVVIIGIVVVLNLFFNYLIQVFYQQPKFENYCKAEQINIAPATQQECLAKGGQWNQSINQKQLTPAAPTAPATTEVNSYCDVTFTCQKNFQTANDIYNRNVFIVLVVLGILSIVLSFALASAAVVSLGLSLGGVLSLIIASIRYWSAMNDYIRVIILGLALGVLIWLGIKKFKE
ncbi:MAG: hypothetical protein NTY66_00815 [Candidatus Vogelbacteria bacterium]|nr:hypothetical protein [Candidatus Vogelbacteria bacterium]